MDINNFFNQNDYIRHCLRAPFNHNGRTIACNGHILLSMPEQDGYQQLDYAGKVEKSVIKIIEIIQEDRDFVRMPENLVFPAKHDCTFCNKTGLVTVNECKECGGYGEVEFSNTYNYYEVECKSCDGIGEITLMGDNDKCPGCHGLTYVYSQHSYVDVMGLHVNPAYLDYIISEPDIEIAVDTANLYLFFRTHDCVGLIMGMRH